MTRQATRICLILLACCVTLTVEAQSLKPVKITPEWTAALRKRIPAKPRCTPKAKRKVLLFSLTTGFKHWVIPHTDVVVRLLGEKTGAYEIVHSVDIAMFERDKLAAFDAVVLNNNCSKGARRNIFLDVAGTDEARAAQLEKNLLDYVARGKGLAVLHGAIVFLNNSPAFSAMIGGSFDFHPRQQEVVLDLVEPKHPLLKAFGGKPFIHVDEPYLFRGAYKDKAFRPLLVMDTSKLDCGKRQAAVASDVRYCAWIKKHGKGRVFYCSPTHNAQSFDDPRLLVFLLDGIQYALGDLDCDDSVKKYDAPVKKQ